MSKKTVFNNDWLKDPLFGSWVRRHPFDARRAECILCDGRTFELGNMGRRALISHANGKKHQTAKSAKDRTQSQHDRLSSYWACVDTSSGPSAKSSGGTEPGDPPTSQPTTSTRSLPVPNTDRRSGAVHSVKSFLAKDATLEAEILWAIKTVMAHYSCNSSDDNNLLFARMFPDSQIAKQYASGKTKCGYLVKFGLAPYFHHKVVAAVSKPGCLYTVSFDESFNKASQVEQMDLILRFWDTDKNCVVSRYFESVFLGHTRAADLLKSFLKGLASLDQANMVQVSMDGPPTNWKFYEDLVQQRNSEDIPVLLNMGSCSLHVIHGAFKRGAQMTGWNVDSFLRSLHYLFHDAPARAEDFVQITGSNQLPLRFCATRWLEDTPVAERAISLWPHIDKYVKETLKLPKSKIPKIQSFSTAQQCTSDPLFPAKLQFFITQAKSLKPYLEKYQTEKPMAVFMAKDLENILETVMRKFVKKDVIDGANGSKLAKTDLDKKENMLNPRKIDVGFASRAIIEKLEKDKKVSQLQLLQFYTECQTFLKAMVEKVVERCPLKYTTVGFLGALDPRTMIHHPESAGIRFQKLLSKLLSLRRFSAQECDEAKQQFESLLREVKKYHKYDCKNFDPVSQRLDTFYFELLDDKDQFAVLWKVVKLVLILSHGQADVERGFSINKDVVSFNMGTETLCAYRMVYDGISQMECKVHEVVISKEMLQSCKFSHQRYRAHVEEQKEKNKTSAAEEKKKEIRLEVDECKKKEHRLEGDANRLLTKADKLCHEAEAKNMISLVTEANALRTKSKLKRKELEVAQKETETAQKKLKLMNN